LAVQAVSCDLTTVHREQLPGLTAPELVLMIGVRRLVRRQKRAVNFEGVWREYQDLLREEGGMALHYSRDSLRKVGGARGGGEETEEEPLESLH
jgi:hypothetical protein